jgi:acyl carrier protein
MNNVIDILSEFTETAKKDILPQSRLIEDLNLTSLDVLDMAGAFEQAYNIEISDKDIKSLHTVQDIYEYLQEYA